jgi:hypothetical protein
MLFFEKELEMEYTYTEEMGEISGMGGDYEKTCQNMVIGGVKWFEEHPNADPHFYGYKGIYGLCLEDNEDAKALTRAVVEAAGEFGPSGAMHQATIAHILHIKQVGWQKYTEEMKERDKE